MDTYARALLAAVTLIEDGVLSKAVQQRYGSFNTGIGAKIEKGETNLEELEVRTVRILHSFRGYDYVT